jgi:hypothetical protein
VSYITLGSRGPIIGQADTTGLNPGNWTVAFTTDEINVNVPYFEVYKMVVEGAANTTFDVYVDFHQWDTAIYGTKNSWDPMQPLIMRPGESLYFLYSNPVVSGNAPVVKSIWLRYDPLIQRM